MSVKSDSRDLDKLYSDFREQEKESLKESIIPFIEGIFKVPRDKKLVMNYQKSETDVFLSIVNGMPSLRKKFWDREVMTNMKTLITVLLSIRKIKLYFMLLLTGKKIILN